MLRTMLLVILLFASGVLTEAHAQTTYQEEVLRALNGMEAKYVALAEAMEDEQYAWRPDEGVRSVGEVLVHVAAANYFFPSLAGVAIPEGVNPREMEGTITEKEAILDALRASFDHAEAAVQAMDDAALTEVVEWFGDTENTKRGVLLGLVEHGGEHLGQLIAYARMNGVTPPWSASADAE